MADCSVASANIFSGRKDSVVELKSVGGAKELLSGVVTLLKPNKNTTGRQENEGLKSVHHIKILFRNKLCLNCIVLFPSMYYTQSRKMTLLCHILNMQYLFSTCTPTLKYIKCITVHM